MRKLPDSYVLATIIVGWIAVVALIVLVAAVAVAVMAQIPDLGRAKAWKADGGVTIAGLASEGGHRKGA